MRKLLKKSNSKVYSIDFYTIEQLPKFDFFDNCPTTECIKLYKTEKGRAYLSRLLEAMVTYMYSDCPLVIAWDNDNKQVMFIYVDPKDLYRLLTTHAETIVRANHQ